MHRSRIRFVVVVVAALAATAVVAGCGSSTANDNSSGTFSGERRLVANAVEDLESAAKKSDEAKICRELLAPDLVDRLGGSGPCQPKIDAALKDTDTFGLTVQSVRVSGTRATARVKADAGDRDRVTSMTLVKVGRGWRISGFGA